MHRRKINEEKALTWVMTGFRNSFSKYHKEFTSTYKDDLENNLHLYNFIYRISSKNWSFTTQTMMRNITRQCYPKCLRPSVIAHYDPKFPFTEYEVWALPLER